MTAAEHTGFATDRVGPRTGRVRCLDCPQKWSAQIPGSPSDDVLARWWERHSEKEVGLPVLDALASLAGPAGDGQPPR